LWRDRSRAGQEISLFIPGTAGGLQRDHGQARSFVGAANSLTKLVNDTGQGAGINYVPDSSSLLSK